MQCNLTTFRGRLWKKNSSAVIKGYTFCAPYEEEREDDLSVIILFVLWAFFARALSGAFNPTDIIRLVS